MYGRAKTRVANISTKKKWTHHRFLHRGPKKDVEQKHGVHRRNGPKKLETVFSAEKGYFHQEIRSK